MSGVLTGIGRGKNVHKILAETNNVETKYGYGRIILKLIFNKRSGVIYIRTIWLRMGLVKL